MKKNLIITDISIDSNTSGVDRYIGILLNSLKNNNDYSVIRLCFYVSNFLGFVQTKQFDDYVEIRVPMPDYSDTIIRDQFWIDKYNEEVFPIVIPYIDISLETIIHIHTINLIDFALLIKRKLRSCKIITHLHCIPWKDLYNRNLTKFNFLYKNYAHNIKYKQNMERYLMLNNEYKSFVESDSIICVTNGGKSFVESFLDNSDKISVITNGIDDLYTGNVIKNDHICNCLYVGNLSRSKGLDFLFEAIRCLEDEGFHIRLDIAGASSDNRKLELQHNYPTVNSVFHGIVPFEDLKKMYETSTFGVIASMQEQASFVAVEMAMFGLPLITTNVDGLDEIFTDGDNALKVHVRFNEYTGLRPDVNEMAQKMKMLMTSDSLLLKLSNNIRQLYLNRLTSTRMMKALLFEYEK